MDNQCRVDTSRSYTGWITKQTIEDSDLGWKIILAFHIMWVIRDPDSDGEEGENPHEDDTVSFSLSLSQQAEQRLQTLANLEALNLEWADLERFHPAHPDHLDLTGTQVYLRGTGDEYTRWNFVPLREAVSLEDWCALVRSLDEETE